jgi:ribosomal protein L37AE/L43A
VNVQHLLFSDIPETTAVQPTLWDMSGPRESDTTCPECARPLVETVSGWWTCPAGCLRLLPQGGME